MRKNKETFDRKIKIEKKCILDILKENDCETIEELKNLVTFLNNENKRLHSMNIESLKKINILSVRVKNLEKLTKNYNEQFNQNKISYIKKYKKKLNDLKNQISILTNYIKDKENEYNRLIEEQEKYFKNFFINLNKNINLIISHDKDKNCSTTYGSSSNSSSLKIKNNEETYLDSKIKNNIFSSSSISNASYFDNKDIEEKNSQILKKKNKDETINEKLNNKKQNYLESDISDNLNKIKLQKKLSDNLNHSSTRKDINKNKEDMYKNVEKIKSLSESIKNIDNELLHFKNRDLSKEKNCSIYSKYITKLDDSLNNSSCLEFEKKKNIKIEENEQNPNLAENKISEEKLLEDTTLSKTVEGSKIEAHKKLNKIIDYNIDIKNRLNNLLEDMYIDGNKKKDNLTSNDSNKNIFNNFCKTMNSNNNLIDILNNKLNITCLEEINNNKPKYVKFNTIHREIMNPRQKFFSQSKSSIDHIICL
ncbi:conserved Plasmodium protein, unknown function [Plasmodium relictum]|uniref:Uncharacterized protein n=1 Tax=Plasmodium relictum TaxID=85471 RepID=A0A1J1H9Z7_PLARL|nr:conserved Plasmodium protein, unknown function [Plasmodium relictum]CRH00249.1 conserved Plasmodium protein, unknown function [Plasmodium relictum]